jgi:hypothetical protein
VLEREIHLVAGLAFLVDREYRKALGRFANGQLDPAKGFIPAELMSDGDDERFRHGVPRPYDFVNSMERLGKDRFIRSLSKPYNAAQIQTVLREIGVRGIRSGQA